MKRCVVQFRDGTYANIKAERLIEKDGMIFAIDIEQLPTGTQGLLCEKEFLVGAFDESCILSIHLSEARQ